MNFCIFKLESILILISILIFSLLIFAGAIFYGLRSSKILPTSKNSTVFEDFEKKKKLSILGIDINGREKEAIYFKEYVDFEKAKSLCESVNRSLPKNAFLIIEQAMLDELFWLEEDEDSRKRLEERNDKVVYSPTNDERKYCAMLTVDSPSSRFGRKSL